MYKASVKERKHLENGGVEPPKTHSSIKAMRTLTKKVNIKFSELYKLTKGTMIQEVFIQEKWLILSKKGAFCDAQNWPINHPVLNQKICIIICWTHECSLLWLIKHQLVCVISSAYKHC